MASPGPTASKPSGVRKKKKAPTVPNKLITKALYGTSNYKKSLGRVLCVKLLAERFVDPSRTKFTPNTITELQDTPAIRDFCWEGIKGVDKASGYVIHKMTPPNQSKPVNFRMHAVAFVALYSRMPSGVSSHLCGNPRCYNPTHVIDESQSVNISRNYCRGILVCPVHRQVIFDGCQCQPKCISQIPPAGSLRCCPSNIPASLDSSPPPGASATAPLDLVSSPPGASSSPGASAALPLDRVSARREKIMSIFEKLPRKIGSRTGQKKSQLLPEMSDSTLYTSSQTVPSSHPAVGSI